MSRPAELDPPGGRREEAGEQVEQRRLAGAVGPDQRVHAAGGDGQVDPVDGAEAAEVTGEPAGGQRWTVHWGHTSSRGGLVAGGHMWPACCGERYDRRHTQAMEAIHTFTAVFVCPSPHEKDADRFEGDRIDRRLKRAGGST